MNRSVKDGARLSLHSGSESVLSSNENQPERAQFADGAHKLIKNSCQLPKLGEVPNHRGPLNHS